MALNDGPVTWQSIGSNHGHIVWVAKENPVFTKDIREEMGTKRAALHGGQNYEPKASVEIILTLDLYADHIRQARSNLREAFSGAKETGFSLYTTRACAGDPRHGASMMIEAWTDDHDSKISVSNALRIMGLVRPMNDHAGPRGLKYSSFQKN